MVGLLVVLAVGQAARAVPHPSSDDVAEDRVVSRSMDSSSEIEPHMAATPEGDVAVVWMAVRGGKDGNVATHIGSRVSHDRGQTWDAIVEQRSPGGLLAADPTVAYFRGAPHVTWLAKGPGIGLVYSAQIGGEAFAVQPDKAPDGAHYYDPHAASGGDRLWIAYRSSSPRNHETPILLASSDDGRAFETHEVAGNGDRPTVCAQGKNVVVVWYDATLGVMVAASQDWGATFTRFAASGASEHVVDEIPSCIVDGDDVWIGYGATDSATPDDPNKNALVDYAVVLRSHDGGKTTRDRSTVRPGAKIMHPALALRASGALDLVYLTGGVDGDKAGRAAAHRVVASGAAKLPRTIREPVIFASPLADPAWGGDYFGVASSDRVTLAAIVDTTLVVSDAGAGGVERHVVIAPIPEE